MNDKLNKIPGDAEKELKNIFKNLFIDDIKKNNDDTKSEMNKNVNEYSEKLTKAYRDFKDCIDTFNKTVNYLEYTEKVNELVEISKKKEEILVELKKKTLSNDDFKQVANANSTKIGIIAEELRAIKEKMINNSDLIPKIANLSDQHNKAVNFIEDISKNSITNLELMNKATDIITQNVKLTEVLESINKRFHKFIVISLIINLIIALSLIYLIIIKY